MTQCPSGLTRVVVADDEPEMRRLLSFDLERHGVEVLEVEDGEALVACIEELVARGDPLPDVIISDVRMPKLDGLGALARIRELAPELPTIVVSGFASSHLRRAAQALGAHTLDKPFEVDDLMSLMTLLLRTPPSRAITLETR